MLYAPGLANLADIEALVRAVDRPVNAIVRADGPTVAELASVGVARISVGGSFTWVALGAVAAAAEELRDAGTLGFLDQAKEGGLVARRAFGG